MKVLLLANNFIGWKVTESIQAAGDEIVAVVVHPEERARYREEILAAGRVPHDRVIQATALREPETLRFIKSCQAEIGVSANFGYIIRRSLLDLLPMGIVNLHTGLLPYNRGSNPNVWSIVERTPAGATLHYIDEGVDTGDIIARREVAVTPIDTGESLYYRLGIACTELFAEAWPTVRSGTNARIRQSGGGPARRVRDLDSIDRIELDRTYTARELIDLLRARTFPPHKGAYFEYEGRRVYMRLDLEYGDESGGQLPEAEQPSAGVQE